jgi:protein-S-isoprenylcysteine O-methyltransferase Ste14
VQSLLLTWPYNSVYTAVVIVTVLPERRMRRQASVKVSDQDRGSSRVLTVGGIAGTIAALILALAAPAASLPAMRPLFWCGVALILAAGLLRQHSFRMLGDSFTLVVHVARGQPLVERGAYRWVRHPAYAAAGLAFIGTGLAIGNWASLAVLTGTWMAISAYRVGVEERAMIATMGDRYREYMKRTKRFIPFTF